MKVHLCIVALTCLCSTNAHFSFLAQAHSTINELQRRCIGHDWVPLTFGLWAALFHSLF